MCVNSGGLICALTFFNLGFFCSTFVDMSRSLWGVLGVLFGSNPASVFGSGNGLFLSDSKLAPEPQVEAELPPVIVLGVVGLSESGVLMGSVAVAIVSFSGLGGPRVEGGGRKDPEDDCSDNSGGPLLLAVALRLGR